MFCTLKKIFNILKQQWRGGCHRSINVHLFIPDFMKIRVCAEACLSMSGSQSYL